MSFSGKVKWFNPVKGYGFILPNDGGKDIFVHVSMVEKSGLKTLEEAQDVTYDVEDSNGKISATNIKIV